mmetsp:Transcript_23519/g.68758  ORF Transcript_23519/g.68758 Transcript_23519/m.68758 type:complete len:234 (+) Transcript_23519:3058-3759(+)
MPPVQGGLPPRVRRRRYTVHAGDSAGHCRAAAQEGLPAVRERGDELRAHGEAPPRQGVPRSDLLPAPQALGGRQDPQPSPRPRRHAHAPAHGRTCAGGWPAHGRDGAGLPRRPRHLRLPLRPVLRALGRLPHPYLRVLRLHGQSELDQADFQLRPAPVQGSQDQPSPHPLRLQAPFPGAHEHVHRAPHLRRPRPAPSAHLRCRPYNGDSAPCAQRHGVWRRSQGHGRGRETWR